MKRFMTLLLMTAAVASSNAQDKLYADEFPLGDVTLLDGPLKKARDLNIQTLLKYDCDRLLAPYRKEAGLEPRAKTYPNWDGLDGHVGGHYLTAMAINAATGSEECRQRMEYMISELQLCAEANAKNHPEWGRGYVGGMPGSDRLWSTFKKGDFGTYFGSWAPFYNLHKMYAGLRDAWLYTGNEQAKKLFLGFCDWAIDLTAGLSDEQMERMLGNEHGGMNEVLADAYAMTGEQKYLTVAKRFSHRRLLTPMSQHVDCLDNMHANTQVPKVVGFERIAELGGDESYHHASSFFWDIVTGERSLAFGGDSRREHFPSKEACTDFINDIDGPESCNTNNMLKLTEDLHRHNPEARYADFYELATFNHILSTQHPEHGGYVYFTPARPRHYRNYSAPNEAMWCCVGTGMENHGKYGQFIYTHVGDALYVNLFVASELNWREKGISLRQETAFPYAETSRITITGSEKRGVKSEKFTLLVRYPEWVKTGTFSVKVNGRAVEIISGPSSYVAINRKWKKGDVIDITFPMHNSVKYLPNVPQYIALMHGPILLGMKTGTEDLAHLIADDSRFGQYASGKKLPISEAPILINNDIEEIANQLKPVEGKPLHFTLETKMKNEIRHELQPFFEIHDARYMIYWLALSENSYKGYLDQLAKAEREQQELEARTIDKVQPGEQQPETDHRMETDESYTGNTNDVFWRDARNGHYFSYLMQTGGQSELGLRLKYWGVGEWKSHEFDIFVDDVLVKSVNNTGKYRISEFKYETYEIPSELLKGKTQIRVKFVAKPGKQIGEIYGIRLVSPPCGPVPTENQLRWQEMEMYAFIHYSLNTYTDEEWGFGNESLELFNPQDLDCRQWARVCKQAGMKGVIFTAKHHCGFCMWPSKYTEYSVKNTPWKNGKGDVVRELADACREEGLKFAVYLSPWDRNHKDYGKPEYVTYFRNQLRELLTEYGDVFEVWFDGANGGDGWYGGANEIRKIDGKTYYQWAETFRMIRELQPQAVIWNDGGDRGDLRWVGTEAGNVGETNWSLLNKEGEVTWHMLHYGLEDGDSWVPGETNTSIRPGWFYHQTEDAHVKSLSKLMDTYYKSVGRNSTLLLNFPIMPNGRIHPTDSLRGIAFKKMIDEVFVNGEVRGELRVESGESNSKLYTLHFKKPTAFNRFVAEEDISKGQRVKKFALEAFVNGKWKALKDELAEGSDGLTTIGHRRIICFPTVKATRLRFTILDSKAAPLIKRVAVYNAPKLTADIPDSGEKLSSDLHIFFGSSKQMFIDFDNEQTIKSFRYLPPQDTRNGLMTHYTLWASSDWNDWKKLASGEFSNIVNNPIWQTIKFAPTKAKVLRLDADRLAEGERMGYEDVEVIRSEK